ncbi:galaxin [Parambassis ranga]|uniref:Galaxin n=1 Tax=Parambassis ranga TaxID=210632 RepID=A0A6P7JLE9_9TELE|nr:galaxin-like [Parambassis ranga]
MQLDHMMQKMSTLVVLGFVGLLCGSTTSYCELMVGANEVFQTDCRKTCGMLQYNVHEAVCCDPNHPPEAGKACCGNKAYNPAEATCCFNGTAHVTLGLSEEVSSCCGLTAYNPLNQICCASKIVDKPSPLAACCDEVPYNVEKQLCCGKEKKIMPRESKSFLCCGNQTYNSSSHCCSYKESNTLEILSKDSKQCETDKTGLPQAQVAGTETKTKMEEQHECINLTRNLRERLRLCYSPDKCDATVTPYDPQTHICCGGHVSERDPQEDQCCGTIPYSSGRRGVLCCNNTLYEGREDAEECSELGIPFNTAKETVCCADYHVEPRKRCCGSHTYEPDRQICCKGHVHERKSKVSKYFCCGTETYDIEKEMCCGGTRLNQKNQVCCSGAEKELVYTVKEGFSCCGHHYYNKALWSCCADRLKPFPETKTHNGSRLMPMANMMNEKLCNNSEISVYLGTLESVTQSHIVFNNVLKIHLRNSTMEAMPKYSLARDYCSFPKLIHGKSYFFDGVQLFVDLNRDFSLQSLSFLLSKCSV